MSISTYFTKSGKLYRYVSSTNLDQIDQETPLVKMHNNDREPSAIYVPLGANKFLKVRKSSTSDTKPKIVHYYPADNVNVTSTENVQYKNDINLIKIHKKPVDTVPLPVPLPPPVPLQVAVSQKEPPVRKSYFRRVSLIPGRSLENLNKPTQTDYKDYKKVYKKTIGVDDYNNLTGDETQSMIVSKTRRPSNMIKYIVDKPLTSSYENFGDELNEDSLLSFKMAPKEFRSETRSINGAIKTYVIDNKNIDDYYATHFNRIKPADSLPSLTKYGVSMDKDKNQVVLVDENQNTAIYQKIPYRKYPSRTPEPKISKNRMPISTMQDYDLFKN